MSKPKIIKSTQSLPILADVRLQALPFYDLLGTLMPPTTLQISKGEVGLSTSLFNFSLTSSHVAEIKKTRYAEPNESQVQVQLRFCQLGDAEQPDAYPTEFQIMVNNKEVALPHPLPTRPGQPLRRPHLPLNITNQSKISPTVSNSENYFINLKKIPISSQNFLEINVRWKPEAGKNFAASVYLVRKLDTKILMKRLREKGIKPDDFTRGVIKEKFQEDGDNEIKTVHLHVSLACPVGKMRMNTPCR
jgi:hypothetical protein